LTPYISAGGGVVCIDGVKKTVIQPVNANQLERVHEPITFAPVVLAAFGLDYKLDPNWSLHFEVRDEVFFTNYNDEKNNLRVLNSVVAAFGVTWAFD
jgi:hypothetical protein